MYRYRLVNKAFLFLFSKHPFRQVGIAFNFILFILFFNHLHGKYLVQQGIKSILSPKSSDDLWLLFYHYPFYMVAMISLSHLWTSGWTFRPGWPSRPCSACTWNTHTNITTSSTCEESCRRLGAAKTRQHSGEGLGPNPVGNHKKILVVIEKKVFCFCVMRIGSGP